MSKGIEGEGKCSSSPSVSDTHRKVIRMILQSNGKRGTHWRRLKENSTNCGNCRQYDVDVESLQEELDELRRRKAFLLSEIAFEESNANTTSTVADVLSRTVAESMWTSQCPYVHRFDDAADLAKLHEFPDGMEKGTYFASVADVLALTERTNGRNIGKECKQARDLLPSDLLSSMSTDNRKAIETAVATDVPRCGVQWEKTDQSGMEAYPRTRTTVASSVLDGMTRSRKRRRVAAAHRLSGISTLNLSDTEEDVCIAARFDVADIIASPGSFTSTYHVFFQLVSQAPIEELPMSENLRGRKGYDLPQIFFLKLTQHTLPPCVDVKEILRRNFASDNCMLEVPQGFFRKDRARKRSRHGKGGVSTIQFGKAGVVKELRPLDMTEDSSHKFLHSLRRCIGDLYDAAHCYMMRRSMQKWLARRVSQDASRIFAEREVATRRCYIHVLNTVSSDSCDRVSLGIHLYGCIVRGENEEVLDCNARLLEAKSHPSRHNEQLRIQRTMHAQLYYEDQLVPLPTKVGLVWTDRKDQCDDCFLEWLLRAAAGLFRNEALPDVLEEIRALVNGDDA